MYILYSIRKGLKLTFPLEIHFKTKINFSTPKNPKMCGRANSFDVRQPKNERFPICLDLEGAWGF